MPSSRDLMIIATLRDIVTNDTESTPPVVTQWMQSKIEQLEDKPHAVAKDPSN